MSARSLIIVGVLFLELCGSVSSQVPGGCCTLGWKAYTSTQGGGEDALQIAFTSIEGCQARCLSSSRCVAIDWDQSVGHDSLRCYHRTTTTRSTSATRTHYQYVAVCTLVSGIKGSFVYVGDYSHTSDLAVSSQVSSQSACLKECVAKTSCLSAAYKSGGTQPCQLSSDASIASRILDSGRKQFIRDTKTNLTTDTSTPPNQVPGGCCQFAWKEFPNTQGSSASLLQNSVATIAACQSACLSKDICTTIDWVQSGDDDRVRCYFRTGSSQTSSPTTTNYQYQAQCTLDTGIQCTFSYSGDYSFPGQLPSGDGISTESDCLRDCADKTTCVSVAYKPGAENPCQQTALQRNTNSRLLEGGRKQYTKIGCTYPLTANTVTTEQRTTVRLTETTGTRTVPSSESAVGIIQRTPDPTPGTTKSTPGTVNPNPGATKPTPGTVNPTPGTANPNPDFTITGVYPSFGPVSGGTNVTVVGQNTHLVNKVQIGSLETSIVYRNNSFLLLRTPAADASLVGQTLVFTTESRRLKFVFVYKPDPVIETIHPLEAIVSGGTVLNITGQNMDAVPTAILRVTMVNRTFNVRDGHREETHTKVFLSVCHYSSATLLQCRVPDMKIDILRTTQSHNKTTINVRTGDFEVTFYVGLSLDGVTTYENISRVPGIEKYGILHVFFNPTLMPVGHVIPFEKGIALKIQGKNLAQGVHLEDYVVWIGLEICVNSRLTSTKLLCWPPDTPPEKRQRNRSPHHQIIVNIGSNLKYNYGQLSYGGNKGLDWPVIVGISIAVVLFVIIIVLALVFFLRRKGMSPTQRLGRLSVVEDKTDAKLAHGNDYVSEDGRANRNQMDILPMTGNLFDETKPDSGQTAGSGQTAENVCEEITNRNSTLPIPEK